MSALKVGVSRLKCFDYLKQHNLVQCITAEMLISTSEQHKNVLLAALTRCIMTRNNVFNLTVQSDKNVWLHLCPVPKHPCLLLFFCHRLQTLDGGWSSKG